MKLLIFTVLFVIVAVSAKPSGVWWGGHGAVDPGAVVVGPAGVISVGPSHGGAVIPGAGWLGHGGWDGWTHGPWGHHGLWW